MHLTLPLSCLFYREHIRCEKMKDRFLNIKEKTKNKEIWGTRAGCAVYELKNVKYVDETRKKHEKMDKKMLTHLSI